MARKTARLSDVQRLQLKELFDLRDGLTQDARTVTSMLEVVKGRIAAALSAMCQQAGIAEFQPIFDDAAPLDKVVLVFEDGTPEEAGKESASGGEGTKAESSDDEYEGGNAATP